MSTAAPPSAAGSIILRFFDVDDTAFGLGCDEAVAVGAKPGFAATVGGGLSVEYLLK